jgi:hypothetical protein
MVGELGLCWLPKSHIFKLKLRKCQENLRCSGAVEQLFCAFWDVRHDFLPMFVRLCPNSWSNFTKPLAILFTRDAGPLLPPAIGMAGAPAAAAGRIETTRSHQDTDGRCQIETMGASLFSTFSMDAMDA